MNLVTKKNFNSPPASHNQKNLLSYHNAHLNELFHKIFRAQFNQDMAIDIRNTIRKFKYSSINKNEDISHYIDRVIDENIKNLCQSKKILIPYFHEIKILINRINNHIQSKISNIHTVKNCHDDFSILVERIKYSCLSSNKKNLSVSKMEIFFHFIGLYFSQGIVNKTEFNNKLEGASYDNHYVNFNFYDFTSSKEIISFNTLKKMIDKKIAKKQVLACDLCDKTHAMAIIVKPLNDNSQIKFEFFDPNQGLFITKSKNVFFELLKNVVNHKNSDFLIDESGERKIEITRQFIVNKKFDD